MSQRRVTRDQLAIVVKLSNESKKEKSIFSYLFIRTKIILTHISQPSQPAAACMYACMNNNNVRIIIINIIIIIMNETTS